MNDPLQLGWFASCDPDEPADRITMAIAYGEDKTDSSDATLPYYSEMWDRLEPRIRAAIARGEVIDCASGEEPTFSEK